MVWSRNFIMTTSWQAGQYLMGADDFDWKANGAFVGPRLRLSFHLGTHLSEMMRIAVCQLLPLLTEVAGLA